MNYLDATETPQFHQLIIAYQLSGCLGIPTRAPSTHKLPTNDVAGAASMQLYVHF